MGERGARCELYMQADFGGLFRSFLPSFRLVSCFLLYALGAPCEGEVGK